MNIYRQIIQYLRMLKMRKTTAAIAIGGFALSLSIVVLLTVFISSELNMNCSYPNVDTIYRVQRDDGRAMSIPMRVADQYREEIAEIKSYSIFRNDYDKIRTDGGLQDVRVYAVDNEYLKIFSHRMVYVGAECNLDIEGNVVLTHSYAKQLFGDVNPVGNYLDMRTRQLKVVGVISDAPINSSLQFDMLEGNKSCLCVSMFTFSKDKYHVCGHFVQLHNSANAEHVAQAMTERLQKLHGFGNTTLKLVPLKKIYFDVNTISPLPVANMSMLKLLFWISLVILLMGVFNYISLNFSMNSERSGEVAMRKTNGANNLSIFRQFMLESVVVCLAVLFLAAAVSIFLSPLFSSLLGKDIDMLTMLSSWRSIAVLTTLFIFIVLLTGIVPSFISSKLSVIRAMKNKRSKSGNRFRNSVLVFQFSISTILLFGVFTIWNQLTYVQKRDVGFNQDLLVMINLGFEGDKGDLLKEQIGQIANVERVSCSTGCPYRVHSSSSFSVGDITLNNVKQMRVDHDFITAMQMRLIMGRDLRKDDKRYCLINEKLFKKLEWTTIENKKLLGDKVAGVIADFQYENAHNEVGFVQLRMKESGSRGSYLNIRLKGRDYHNTLSQIKEMVANVAPELDFSYEFYDDRIAALYEKEKKQAKAVGVFAIIAVMIACLGLIGVAEHTIKQRIKEVGVRKVNGATVFEVLTMIGGGFLKWALLAFVLAAPVAFYVMSLWLEDFVYKTELSWWLYMCLSMVVVIVATLTIFNQLYRAASRNPIEALRYE